MVGLRKQLQQLALRVFARRLRHSESLDVDNNRTGVRSDYSSIGEAFKWELSPYLGHRATRLCRASGVSRATALSTAPSGASGRYRSTTRPKRLPWLEAGVAPRFTV